jgi:hypothetical protein
MKSLSKTAITGTIPATVLACLAIATSEASAVVINFTAGEGYVAGNIEAQPGAGNPWDVVNGAITTPVSVNPPGLSLSLTSTNNTNTTTGQPVYQTGQNYQLGAITTYIDFSFTQTSAAVTGETSNVVGLQYLTGPSSGNLTSMVALFGRTITTATPYRIALATTVSSFTEANLGINVAESDFVSDQLRLSMTITRLDTTDQWTRSLTLVNLSTSTTVASVASNSFTTSANPAVWTDTALHPSFHNYADTGTLLTALNVTAFGLEQVPEPITAALLLPAIPLLLRRRRG